MIRAGIYGASGYMGGDAILEAQGAFYEELVSFLRMLGHRDVVKAAATQQRTIGLVIRASEARIDAADPEREVAAIYGDSPTSSEPSPGSAPGPTP